MTERNCTSWGWRQERLCGLLVGSEHISSPLPSDMSCQCRRPHTLRLGTSIKWSVSAIQPEEDLEQKIRACRYSHHIRVQRHDLWYGESSATLTLNERWLILRSETPEAKTALPWLTQCQSVKGLQDTKVWASCNGYVDIHDRRSDRNVTAWVFGLCKQKIGNWMLSMISQLQWWAHRGEPWYAVS